MLWALVHGFVQENLPLAHAGDHSGVHHPLTRGNQPDAEQGGHEHPEDDKQHASGLGEGFRGAQPADIHATQKAGEGQPAGNHRQQAMADIQALAVLGQAADPEQAGDEYGERTKLQDQEIAVEAVVLHGLPWPVGRAGSGLWGCIVRVL